MTKIVVVDLGTGNLRSVSKAVGYVCGDANVSVTSDQVMIRNCEYMILPGQGAIGTWFNQLNQSPQLKQAVLQRLSDGPVLGICLGLQALYQDSEENGGTEGLGIMPGTVKHFSYDVSDDANGDVNGNINGQRTAPSQPALKVPHMGWNQVKQNKDHPVMQGIADQERFYFVHSYYVQSGLFDQVVGQCLYGHWFTAAAATDNIFATQFHPEKSQQAGLKLLKNFINWNGYL